MGTKILFFVSILSLFTPCGLAQDSTDEFSESSKKNISAVLNSVNSDVECSQGHSGTCFRKGTNLVMCGEYMTFDCEYTGNHRNYCFNPCDRGEDI